MLEIETRGKKLMIGLNPGIHVDVTGSGSGKTYLYELFRSERQFGGCDIYSLTYDEFRDKTIEKVMQEILAQKYELIFFDRYDLYCCEELNQCLGKLAMTTPILLDLKCVSKLHGTRVRMAVTKLQRELIYVRSEDDF